MENKYLKIAKDLVGCVGEENILSVTHCATRLRFIVKNRDAIDDKAVEKVDEVKGVFYTAGQYQIILGTGIVNKVHKEIETLGLKTVSKQEQEAVIKANEKGIKRFMRILADIFVPIIPVIAATGLFLGLKGCVFNESILGLFGMSTEMIPLYIQTLVSVLTETAFAFLPAIICWSTFRVFGGTPVIGIVIGLMLVSPILPNAYAVADPNSGIKAIMAFGFIPIVGCQGSVLTAIVAGFIGSKLEQFFRRIMPNVLDMIFTPFFVMLITMLIIFLGVGPIMHGIELGMVGIIESLIGLPFGIGGFLIGFTYPLAVLTGLHHTYLMIETSLLSNTGFNPLITLCAMYGFANVGACLAFAFKAKKETVKATSIGAMLSQLFGISEPVLFGVLIRYNFKPLYMVLLTSGIGAAVLSILNVQSNSYGLAVIPSYLMYIYNGSQLLFYTIVSLASVALCFLLTWLFGVPKEVQIPDEEELTQPSAIENTNTFLAPATGTLLSLEEVSDTVFSQKILGDGFAIDITEGKIIAPVSGQLITAYPTGHAYGIRTDKGQEILIHIGMDTVELKGEGFTTHVTQDSFVKQGDLLVEVNLESLKKSKKSKITPVIFLSGETVTVDAQSKALKKGTPMTLNFFK